MNNTGREEKHFNNYVMKRFFISFFVVVLITFYPGRAQDTVEVKLDADKTYQTIEGWGSSLCWWANMVGKWEDEAKIDEIIDLITSPDQLNMNIFRYNIGGGDDPSHYSTPGDPGHMAEGKGVRAEMEGFKPGEDSLYDWTADPGQRKIMLKIKEKRPDAVFEAFSNSPPYWMTYSGCSAGNDPASADNLKPEYYGMFCNYLIDVCKFYKDSFGIEFKTLEPFNESLTGYWGYLGGQEGCHFDLNSQIGLLRVLYPKLQNSGLNTVIAASDESGINSFLYAMNGYIKAGDIPGILGQLNTHTYSGSNAERVEAYNLSRKMDKTLWQSETGPIGIGGSGLENNIRLAQRLFDDIRYMKPSAWLDWQLMEEHNDTWCQLRCDFEEETYNIVKNFYVRMQVTRFIKQGYVIIESGNMNTLAALSPGKDELVMSVINFSGREQTFDFDLSEFRETAGSAKFYRTSTIENCEDKGDLDVSQKKLLYTSPDMSISTFVLPVKVFDYNKFAIIHGISFEDGTSGGFKGDDLTVDENQKKDGLNNSQKSLISFVGESDTIIYQFEDTLFTSPEARYLHVMTYTPDIIERSPTSYTSNDIYLGIGNEWKDQVIDLEPGNFFNRLNFHASVDNTEYFIDNICINSDPNERVVTEDPPVYDFESSQATPACEFNCHEDRNPGSSLTDNNEIVGINTSANILECDIPKVADEGHTEDTLVILLGSPLLVTDQSRFLHVMVKSPIPKLKFEVNNVVEEKLFSAGQWIDLVVDLEDLSGENIYEIKISPYGSTILRTILFLDNISFNNDPEPLEYKYETPEQATYIIYSRNSDNVLTAGNNENVIQTTPDKDYIDTKEHWDFYVVPDGYVISNKASHKVITDDGSYFLRLEERSGNLDGQVYNVSHVEGGYVRINSIKTGKAMDVEGGSTASGASVGLWDFGATGNYHRQWALIHISDDITGLTPSEKKIDSPFVVPGFRKITIHNLETPSSVDVFNINGMVVKKDEHINNTIFSIKLDAGIYILHIKSASGIYYLKGIVM